MQTCRPLASVLVKPAGARCFLECRYCFYRSHPQNVEAMSPERLEMLVKQCLEEAPGDFVFVWQGGEPALAGIDFFRKAFAFQRKYARPGQCIGNGFQTNGLLLDAEWAALFREAQVLVGLSLDGPEPVHDRHRRRSGGGRGTWHEVVAKARLLMSEGVAVNAMAVVTEETAPFVEETYAFHKGMGFEFLQYIPCVETDAEDPSRAAPFSLTAETYGEFLCRLFDLWWEDFFVQGKQVFVRFFDDVFYGYAQREPPTCVFHERCGPYLVIEADGGVYSCDFFVNEEHRLGTLGERRLTEFLNSPAQRAFGARKAELDDKCGSCAWLSRCRGGCLKDRCRDRRDAGHNHFCRAYERFFEHADGRMRLLAQRLGK